jgi:WD40 repeat protein
MHRPAKSGSGVAFAACLMPAIALACFGQTPVKPGAGKSVGPAQTPAKFTPAPQASGKSAPPAQAPAKPTTATTPTAKPGPAAQAPAGATSAAPSAAKPGSATVAPGKAAPPAPAPAKDAAPLPAIYSLAFSLDGKRLAVGTHKEAVLYDTADWSVIEAITQVKGAVRALTFHPDGKHLAIGGGITGATGNLMMCDPADLSHPANYGAAKDTIESVAFSSDGAAMLTASFDNKARFYPNTYYRYGDVKLEEHNGRVTTVAFSPKPNYIFITGAMDKMVKVWDLKSERVVVNFDQASAGITGLTFLSNGDQFVGSSLDGNLYWWAVNYNAKKNIYSGNPFRTIKAHEGGVTAFSASADHKRFATGGSDHLVRVWKTDDGGVVRDFKEPKAPVYCTALSPDGKVAAAAGREGIVWVWDVEANKLITTISPPRPSGANGTDAADHRAASGASVSKTKRQ